MAQSLYGPQEENREIWVFVEQHEGVLEKVSVELLGKGRQLADESGWPLVAMVAGEDVGATVDEVAGMAVDQVLNLDHVLLRHFCVDACAAAVFQAIMARRPSVFLIGATSGGRDLAGRLAVRLRTGLNADCTDLRLSRETGVLVCEVSGYGGGVLALIEMVQHRPQMATVRPGVFPAVAVNADEPRQVSEVTPFPVELTQPANAIRLISRVVGQGVDLSATPVLVAGGRGVDGNFDMLRQLAGLLGGDVGATRPPVDEGHIRRHRQIGQTGVVCRPKVAIVCGASGAFHFVVGVQEADVVIAVNTDPEAPIFEHADYGVVADAHKVVPALIEALSSVAPDPVAESGEVIYG